MDVDELLGWSSLFCGRASACADPDDHFFVQCRVRHGPYAGVYMDEKQSKVKKGEVRRTNLPSQ